MTGTIFSGHHQPLRVWMCCLYLMGLNVSNRQIGHELGLSESDSQQMTDMLSDGIYKRRKVTRMQGEIECDEVYVIAGHKGKPENIHGRLARRNRLKGARGRGTLEKEKPPIFGMIERNGSRFAHFTSHILTLRTQSLINRYGHSE